MKSKTIDMKTDAIKERGCIDDVHAFVEWLQSEERSEGTIEKYTREINKA